LTHKTGLWNDSPRCLLNLGFQFPD
jgi:hypothetical protein